MKFYRIPVYELRDDEHFPIKYVNHIIVKKELIKCKEVFTNQSIDIRTIEKETINMPKGYAINKKFIKDSYRNESEQIVKNGHYIFCDKADFVPKNIITPEALDEYFTSFEIHHENFLNIYEKLNKISRKNAKELYKKIKEIKK